MKDTLENLLRLQPQNLIPEIWFLMAGVWVALVVISLFSVLSSEMKRGAKVLWMGGIVFFPGLGLLGYCAYSFGRVDWRPLAGFFRTRQSVAAK